MPNYLNGQNKMNKVIKSYLNGILILIIIILISWNLVKFNQPSMPTIINNNQPNYQTGNAITIVYDQTGRLTYRVITDKIYYFSNSKISWFINPVLTTYNIKSIPICTIRANKAKLINSDLLYLYGNVQINNLNPTSNLQKILTENAIINLITQDILSNDKVTIIGTGLRSVGMKMRGNIKIHTAELIENIKTYYKIPNKKTTTNGATK